ncbi:hypothetical protein DFH09DRAFT_1430818 [Mycena vulgaris]|nr:hypothetical protein DFH09DRAFT_1485371 [Mycena vulgaris]KAJ6587230.1 hypothetical protein DFH09DRAFT_1430818 [Mycena vulgaris]
MSNYRGANLDQVRTSLLDSDQYLSSPTVVAKHGWKRRDGGHIVCVNNGDANGLKLGVFVSVGRVVDDRLDVTGLGSWRDAWAKTTMDKAKFQFLIEKPTGTPFAADWDLGMRAAEKVQMGICDGKRARNWIVKDPTGDILQGYNTEGWPLPDGNNMRARFNTLVQTFSLRPLRVIDVNDHVIPPQDILEALRGSLVVCSYMMKHWEMKDAQGIPYNSFTANCVQIVVLQYGRPDEHAAVGWAGGLGYVPPPINRERNNAPAPVGATSTGSGAQVRPPGGDPTSITPAQSPVDATGVSGGAAGANAPPLRPHTPSPFSGPVGANASGPPFQAMAPNAFPSTPPRQAYPYMGYQQDGTPPGFYSPYPPNYVNASPLSHYNGGGWNQRSPMVHAPNGQLPSSFYTHSVSDLVPFENGGDHGADGDPPFGGMPVTMYGDAAQLAPSQLHPSVDGVQGGGSLSFMQAHANGEKQKTPKAAATGGGNTSGGNPLKRAIDDGERPDDGKRQKAAPTGDNTQVNGSGPEDTPLPSSSGSASG